MKKKKLSQIKPPRKDEESMQMKYKRDRLSPLLSTHSMDSTHNLICSKSEPILRKALCCTFTGKCYRYERTPRQTGLTKKTHVLKNKARERNGRTWSTVCKGSSAGSNEI